jgi:hypothetical protein
MPTIEELYERLLEECLEEGAPGQTFKLLFTDYSPHHSQLFDLLGVKSELTGDKLTSFDLIRFLTLFAKGNKALEAATKAPKLVGIDRRILARGNAAKDKNLIISHLTQKPSTATGRQVKGQPVTQALHLADVEYDDQLLSILYVWYDDIEVLREVIESPLFHDMKNGGMTEGQALGTAMMAAADASIGVGAADGRGCSGAMEMTLLGVIKRNFGSPFAKRIFMQAFKGPTGERRGKAFAEAALSQMSSAYPRSGRYEAANRTAPVNTKGFVQILKDIAKSLFGHGSLSRKIVSGKIGKLSSFVKEGKIPTFQKLLENITRILNPKITSQVAFMDNVTLIELFGEEALWDASQRATDNDAVLRAKYQDKITKKYDLKADKNHLLGIVLDLLKELMRIKEEAKYIIPSVSKLLDNIPAHSKVDKKSTYEEILDYIHELTLYDAIFNPTPSLQGTSTVSLHKQRSYKNKTV